MIGSRITQEATLHRWTKLPTKDAMGDEQYEFVDVPVMVELQQHSANEARGGQIVGVSFWAAYFRPDAVLNSLDELSVPGYGRFSFDGHPWLVRHPRTGRSSHWLARLKKVT